jgi:hypothetical protein
MDEELEKQALREALYEGFEPPSPEFTETVLASVGAAGALPALLAWLQAHWVALSATLTVTGLAAAGAAAVVLNQPAPPPPPPPEVYVGYANTTQSGAQTADLPSPWYGSPNLVFQGTPTNFDAGAVRIENRSGKVLTVDRVTVDVGAQHFDLWPTRLTVPAHGSVVLTQTNGTDFDTSDTNPPNCQPSTLTPVVHVTIGGKTRDYADVNRVLTTGGVDRGNCGALESHPWERMPG